MSRRAKRILVVHGWLTGNLGDVMQTAVLLAHLRSLRPESLVLSGYAVAVPLAVQNELGGLVDEVRREADRPGDVGWLRPLSRSLSRLAAGRRWQRSREDLFLGFDVIVAAPGPYIWEHDARRRSAYLDLGLARRLGKPFLLSSHSIGPLPAGDYRHLRAAACIVSREPATGRLLEAAGLPFRSSADYAFLYEPAEGRDGSRFPAELGPRYTALFMRSKNLDPASVKITSDALHAGGQVVPLDGRAVLATSDPVRDDALLGPLSREIGIPFVSCRTAPELVDLVRNAAKVVSDRYHPLVAAAAGGVPVDVLPLGFAPTKMAGLQELLAGESMEGIRALARSGLEALSEAIETA